MKSGMTSSKPYLLEAFLDWIVDNNCTPYLMVDANYPGVKVPTQYIENGRIVLNIAPEAVHQFETNRSFVCFSARFAGVSHDIYVPLRAVSAIYAKENGRGMVFKEEEDALEEPAHEHGQPAPEKRAHRPTLTVVKSDKKQTSEHNDNDD